MSTFTYVAKNKAGQTVKGNVAAGSRQEVLERLRQMELVPTQLGEERGGKKRKSLSEMFSGGKAPKPRVSGDDRVVFTRQLATMISSGIALMEALEILTEQASDPGFKAALTKAVEDIRGGADFSTALSQIPGGVFDKIYINMVRAGEASGKLDDVLNRLAEYQENAQELKREVKSAMTYPTISLVMVVGIATFLMLVIVPKFQDLFENVLGGELPMPTQVVMGISMFLRGNLLLCVGVFAAAAVAIFLYVRKTEQGAWQWDWLKLHLPVFGPLFQKLALSRFARTFGTLVQSGVPILGSLEIVSLTAGNRLLEKAVNDAQEAVRQGEQLATPLAKSPIFPPMVTRMIAVGEKTGALEVLLEKISDFYDQQVRATVKSLTSLIEPLMIGMMGLLVGGIVVAIFLPIFKAPTLIRK